VSPPVLAKIEDQMPPKSLPKFRLRLVSRPFCFSNSL
jgi:hypothetical protein